MSKFSLEILNRAVFPFIKGDDPDVLLGAAFGEDVALTRVGGDVLASHVDPIIGAIGGIGRLAVHVACNDVAASGVQPRWLQLLVIVPGADDESLLAEIMADAGAAAEELGASIVGGHTGYSAGVSRPLVAVTALGVAGERPAVLTGGARVGDDIWVTKGVGLEGTAILAEDFADVARKLGLSDADLAAGRALLDEISVVPEARALAELGATAMHDVTRGGLLEAALEIAFLSGVSLELDVRRLPRREIVDRFADAFGFDPLRMISSGTLVATLPATRRQAVARVMAQLGVPCVRTGRVVAGEGVVLSDGLDRKHVRELRPEADELARLWDIHPRVK